MQKCNQKKSFKKEYPLTSWLRQYSIDRSTLPFLVFEFPSLAKQSGFFPRSYWKQQKREVLPNQQAAYVPTSIWQQTGLSWLSQEYLLQQGNVYHCFDADEYFSIVQTIERQPGNRGQGGVEPYVVENNPKAPLITDHQEEPETTEENKESGVQGGVEPYVVENNQKRRGRPKGSKAKAKTTGIWFNTPKALVIPEDKKNLESAARYIVHEVLVQLWNRKHDSGRARLTVELLRHIVGDPATELAARKWLVESGVLLTDGSFVPGVRSKEYRLNPIYRLGITRCECQSASMARKILLARSQRLDKKTSVDEKVEQVVSGDKPANEQHLDKWLHNLCIDIESCKAKYGEHNSNLQTAECIHNKDLKTSRDKHGRFHSALTRLFCGYREFLSWDNGERGVSLDVKNSQPLSAAKLVRESYWANDEDLPEDVVQFVADAESGEIYDKLFARALAEFPEYLLKRKERALQKKAWKAEREVFIANQQNRPSTKEEWKQLQAKWSKVRKIGDVPVCVGPVVRSDFKVFLFADIFFGRAEITNNITKLFASLYPSVAEWIKQKKSGGYKKFAHLLQREESKIIIDTIVERLRLHHPDVPVATIHDSIVTSESNVALVLRVMRSEYERIGLRPTIKQETY